MNKLAKWLADAIRERVAETRFDAGSQGETRLIFHGPPLEILRLVFEELVGGDGRALANLPVLLQVPRLGAGERNPLIGESGPSDESHLLNLRNSPKASSYLALVPPGTHAIRSVSSTTDEFGVAAANNGGNVTFDDWVGDPFVQRAIENAIEATGVLEREEARSLLLRALHAVDDVDGDKAFRRAAWCLISRIFSVTSESGDIGRQISLACGVPPMAGDELSAALQQSSLKGIAAALSDGFQSGLSAVLEEATPEQREWLEAFLVHIKSTCDVSTALERAPEAFYAPSLDLVLREPPAWWLGLTAELWADLLTDEPEFLGDIHIECQGTLLPPTKGVPLVVSEDVDLVIQAQRDELDTFDIRLERSPAKNKDGFPFTLSVQGETEFRDPAPPLHKAPIQYKASAEGCRPASVKVICLANWLPGIFVGCRIARKVSAPRPPARRTRGAEWETNIFLPGPGRFELLVFLRSGATIVGQALGAPSGEANGVQDRQQLAVREMRPGLHQIEVELEGAYQVDIAFDRPDKDGRNVSETCRVFLSCEDVIEDGCRSEFERLIKLNRRKIDASSTKPIVQLNRSTRSSSLQDWMLQADQASNSFLPLVLADDYDDHWVQPDWSSQDGRILSAGKFLKDPRPPASDFHPPKGFVEARQQLAELVRGTDEQAGLLEGSALGEWLSNDQAYEAIVEAYLDAYIAWLAAEPDIAPWVDVVAIASLEPDGRTLSRVPDAILLSPLHPLRIAWHSVAQSILHKSASGNRPCPAAGVFDPRMVPDLLKMPLLAPQGVERHAFLSVECNSDYWSVLWNGTRLRELSRRSQQPPFGPAFGLTVGGISTGFSTNQVIRVLDDVSDVLCAKPIVSVVVASAGGATDACNEGLMEWSSGRYADRDRSPKHLSSGSRRLDIFDLREQFSRPDEATVANLSDDTRNKVRWYSKPPRGMSLDLGIIAQLDASEPQAAKEPMRSALGAGGLLRHRIRRQLPGCFLSESRQALNAGHSGDPLADKVAACIATIENTGDLTLGLCFAPNVHAISDMLEDKGTDFVAISSSAVDPACFLGGWLEEAYLWDYDLPSYSQRAGDTNGYYVLSKVKSSDRDGMRKVLSRLPRCGALSDEEIGDILLEVARRGIPTIRGLSGDDTGATGDLGLFVAVRFLQDRFRLSSSPESLLPVIGGSDQERSIALVIPVDPFRGYLEDLSRALNRERADASMARPDLIVVSVSLGIGRVRIHITPIEVKARFGGIFPAAEVGDALGQAKALSDLLGQLSRYTEPLSAWRFAYHHLLLAIIGFGMRVYSQHQDLAGDPGEWAAFHEKIAGAILGDSECVTVDARGRLIVVDDNPMSAPHDFDNDGFEETIVIGLHDAGRIVAGDAQVFYNSVRAKMGDWALAPAAVEAKSPVEQPQSDNSSEATIEPDPDEQAPSHGEIGEGRGAEAAKDDQQKHEGIRLGVGRLERAFERKDVQLAISDTRLNQLNMGVVGDLGTGKTQLLKALVYQIASSSAENRGIRPRIMIFDYKRDYSSPDFVEATGARVLRPYHLPLNLFDTSSMGDTTVPWLDRFRFFADVLDKIYSGIGPVQRDKLKRAVRAAYEAIAGRGSPTIYDVHAAYAELLDGKSDSPMAIIGDLVDMEIFERDPSKTLAFGDFLDGVVVVSLDALGQDDRSKNMLVAVMLNMFYENMLRTPKRPFLGTSPQLRALDSYLLVDEADNIMRYEFDVLRKLLLQGREFGCGIILASQYLRHFKVNATDYREPLLTWFVHKVPNVTPAELSALGLAATAAEMAERVKTLPNHHCLYKSYDNPGQIIRGSPFYELNRRERR